MWVVGTSPVSSARAVSAINHRAISPVHTIIKKTCKLWHEIQHNCSRTIDDSFTLMQFFALPQLSPPLKVHSIVHGPVLSYHAWGNFRISLWLHLPVVEHSFTLWTCVTLIGFNKKLNDQLLGRVFRVERMLEEEEGQRHCESPVSCIGSIMGTTMYRQLSHID